MKNRLLVCLSLLSFLVVACGDPESQKSSISSADSNNQSVETSQNNSIQNAKSKPFDLAEQQKAYKLTQYSILDINESPYDRGPALAVSFSVPLDLNKNIQDKFTVLDDNKTVEGGWVTNDARTTAYFQYIEPGKSYKVIVDASISSINGQQLVREQSKSIQTNSLADSVRFTNKGEILPSKLTRGISVESVNIKEVDINFHRVYDKSIPQVISERLDGYSFYVQGLSSYSDLAFSARYSLDYAKNKKRTTILPIHKIKELQQPGYYIAVMKPAGEYPYDYQVASFYISDLAIHTTSFNSAVSKRLEVHSLSIENGKTLTNVELTLVNLKGEVLQKAKTDQQGNYVFANVDQAALIIAAKDNDFSVISLKAPALDLSEQISLTRFQQQQELFLYGPRDLYRPGETIYVNGLLRDHDGQLLPSVPLDAKLLRPDGRIASNFSWHAKSKGFYTKSFEIGKSDPTGEWTLQVTHPGKSVFQYNFSIEEFMPEKMKLDLKSEQDKFVSPKQDIQISAQGDYLYGAPASGNRIAARIKVKPNHFPLKTLKEFYFGRVTSDDDIVDTDLDDQMLDKKGKAEWLLPNLWKGTQHPTQIVFEASLFESGGRPVTRRIRQEIWPGEHQIGLRPLNKEKIINPFSQVDFEMINSDQNENLKAIGQLEINLIREDTDYFWREDNNGWGYGETEKESRVYSRMVDFSEQRTSIQLPVDYGNYRLEIKDSRGELKNSYKFFAGWSWDNDGGAGRVGARPDKVRIQFDQESYSANQVAKVTLISPHLGEALVRIESNKILWEKKVLLTKLQQQIEIPISAEWSRHDLYVTALVVSPAKEESSNGETIVRLPKRALGIQALTLDRSSRHFEIVIDAPEVVEPEQTIAIKLSIKDSAKGLRSSTSGKASDKKSDKTWVTLAAVDTGVLSLSAYKTPNPFDWFYGQRAYRGNIRDSFSRLIKNEKGKLGGLRFGGDAELSRGGEQPTTDVQIVSIFSQLVEFDDQGNADISLDLPNFNGELRLMALAFSNDRFASQETTMKVRAPLVADMSTPRFLAKNDRTNIAFDLQNMTGIAQNLTAKISFTGTIVGKDKNIDITLADGEKLKQKFAIEAASVGKGNILLSLLDDKGNEVLSREWFINVRSAYPAEFTRHRKILKPGGIFSLQQSLVNKYDQSSLQAKLTMSATPPLNTGGQLQGLLQYPYGCLEQTSSRAWPLLTYQSFSQPIQLDERGKKVLAEKNKHINAAIQRINGMQRNDGSFGLWSNQSPENHWLTVYALDFLLQAKQSGYSVPQSVLDNGIARIKSYLESTQPSYSERQHYSQNAKHYALAFRAYAAYLLSKNGQVSLSDIRQLYNKLAGQARSALPLAHLAIAFENSGDNGTAKKLWKKAIGYNRYSLEYSGDYGSLLRDTSWLMTLATESKLSLDYQDLIFTINDELIGKQWFSTQERFSIYRLALALDNSSQPNWAAKMSSSSAADVPIENQKNYSQWLNAQLFDGETQYQMTEGKSLFVDLQIVGYPLKAPKKTSKGVSSQKRFYNLQGKKISLNRVKSGDYVLVRLDVSSSKKMPDALLVDLLPAGFEIENPGLEFAQDFSEIRVDGNYVYEWHYQSEILHTEYRDDRFVAALSLDRRQSSVMFYLMRAVNPGHYQVPPVQVEDMYRPYLRSLSKPLPAVTVTER